jgi:hypothetical protein
MIRSGPDIRAMEDYPIGSSLPRQKLFDSRRFDFKEILLQLD